MLYKYSEEKEIEIDIKKFMLSFSLGAIVAMYEPYDKDSTKYRIQVHLRNEKNSYLPDDYEYVLKFFKKYTDQGYGIFSLFEKIFIKEVCNYKNLSCESFFQVSNENEDTLHLDALAREAQFCGVCESGNTILEKDMSDVKKKDRMWLTLNKDISGEEIINKGFSQIWDHFYNSLVSGHGSIGFEDYVTGVTIRGAITDKDGNFQKARDPEDRFKEKRKILKELLTGLKKKCNSCGGCYQDSSYKNGQGEVIKDSQSNMDMAFSLKQAQRNLGITEAILSDEKVDVASSYNDMSKGNACYLQGQYDEALKYYQQSLVTRQAVYGDNHFDVASSHNNIGNAYYSQGKYVEALEHYQQSLAIRKHVYGDNHPDVACSYNNMGNVYYSQGKCDEALKCHQESLAIRKQAYGNNRPLLFSTLRSISLIYNELNRRIMGVTSYPSTMIFSLAKPNLATIAAVEEQRLLRRLNFFS